MDVIGGTWEGGTVWVQDFAITGAEIDGISSPRQILYSSTLDNPEVTGYVHDIDLSPDLKTLAMDYYHRDSDGSGYSSIRVIDIAECLVNPPCPFNAAKQLVSTPRPGTHGGMSWGPMTLQSVKLNPHLQGGFPVGPETVKSSIRTKAGPCAENATSNRLESGMEAIWHLYWRVLSRMQQVGFPGERNFEMAVVLRPFFSNERPSPSGRTENQSRSFSIMVFLLHHEREQVVFPTHHSQ